MSSWFGGGRERSEERVRALEAELAGLRTELKEERARSSREQTQRQVKEHEVGSLYHQALRRVQQLEEQRDLSLSGQRHLLDAHRAGDREQLEDAWAWAERTYFEAARRAYVDPHWPPVATDTTIYRGVIAPGDQHPREIVAIEPREMGGAVRLVERAVPAPGHVNLGLPGRRAGSGSGSDSDRCPGPSALAGGCSPLQGRGDRRL